ncbi:MAG: ROK family protein [Thermoleophilia bacterium]|nr:ROK family protein [Thermoleophilia bacterium]
MVLGVDLGGTNLKAAVVEPDGRIVATSSEPSLVAEGPEAAVARMAALVEKMRQEHDFGAVGAAICAPIEKETGRIAKSASLPGWIDVPVRDLLEQHLAMPVTLENDAASAILAEWWLGAGESKPVVAGLTLGTGVGGGLVIDGRIYSGSDGLAGEFGHISLADGPECPCGSSGCLGRLAGGTATGARYQLLSGEEPVRTDEIIRRAANGDTAAQEALETTVGYLVRGVRTLVNLLNPDVFVLCGGLSCGWGDPLAEAIQAGLKGSTFPGLDETPIRISELGAFAGAIGAARLALDD